MRDTFVVFCVAIATVVMVPASWANTNQAAAEKIAKVLGEQYPEYDIAVSYQKGKVRLVGRVASPELADKVVATVRRVNGIQIDAVDNALSVGGQNTGRVNVGTPIAARPAPMPPQQAAPLPMYAQAVAMPESTTAMPNGRPVPGQYNQPTMPEYAWPSYAAYPNYAEVAYPRQHAAGAWPFIGPYYPYPQVPLGWRKTTLEWHDGWWWMDFDDGTNQGPFSPVFRQPMRYTY
ncbi:MAG: BON domain-containing protein [Thermoguttaceae bacterium]